MVVVSIQNADPSIPLNPIKAIIQAALDAADPYRLIRENLKIEDNILRVGDRVYNLQNEDRIIIVGLGKASVEMVKAAEAVLGERIHDGLCVCKHNPMKVDFRKISIFESAHPIPDERSVHAANLIRQSVSNLKNNDIVLLLLSGGGSSLACLPAEGISLADIQRVTGILLKNGATINEINIVRKHLDAFKGGGFARMVQPARIAVMVLSDVIGSPLDVIASGPAFPDSTSFADAVKVLQKFIPEQEIPNSVKDAMEKGYQNEVRDSPNKNNGSFKDVYHKVIGSNVISVDAAARKARDLGFFTHIHSYSLQGEARTAGLELLKNELPRPFAVLAGGETTVTIHGTGLGGRNLEMALGAAKAISGYKNKVIVTLATDGEDGPTDAAGAIVTSEKSLDIPAVNQSLETNDSYNYFKKNGGLITTGPTGTNVNDIAFVIGY